ncbi:unnamed protein product [Rhodiola kirilowii]
MRVLREQRVCSWSTNVFWQQVKAGECSSTSSVRNPTKRMRLERMSSTVTDALEDITALFYDEERYEIYAGNEQGLVHVWSN